MKAIALAAALAFPGFCLAQTPKAATPATATPVGATPVITVEFSDPQLSPSHWTLVFHPDGSGHFRSTAGPAAMAPAAVGDDPAEEIRIPDQSRDIQLSPRFAASVFQAAQRHAWFNQPCESHIKVAFQGWKTLSYSGPNGKGSCTFNFSRDKEIQSLGDNFVGVSETIIEGARLQMLLQHDPLGLDKEIQSLIDAAQDGRAQQLCVIKDILQRIAQDDNVMEMVRKRARFLLSRADT